MFYNLHTHLFTNDSRIKELVNQYPWNFDPSIPQYSIGIHPWYLNKDRLADDLRIIKDKLKLGQCLALGECGLDRRIEIPMELQTEVFEKQIDLAEQYGKPLVLHLVAAFDELISIKKSKDIHVPVIIHGFSKSKQLAAQLLDNGFYLSFGKYLLRNPDLKETFQFVPDNRFFLETDTMEESLTEVYHRAASYKTKSLEEMQELVESNWNEVFK